MTASPPGPSGTFGRQAAPLSTGPVGLVWQLLLPPTEMSSPSPTVTSAATTIPMTQPRTVRNLVHSARSNCPNPSRASSCDGR